jgi:hypothetical protein
MIIQSLVLEFRLLDWLQGEPTVIRIKNMKFIQDIDIFMLIFKKRSSEVHG